MPLPENECKECGESIENEEELVFNNGLCDGCFEEKHAGCWGGWNGF